MMMRMIPGNLKEYGPLLRTALTVAVTFYLLRQVRKPSKWTGRFFLWIMNLSHSNVTNWGLQHVRIENNFTILDIGCGGGRTIQKVAAAAAQGKIYGVDYADGSVAASRSLNAPQIAAGRVEIKQASVSQLPFGDNMFDLITAVETQYYWPDLPNDMREVLRVLKPGGELAIIAETYKSGATDFLQGPVMKLLGSSGLTPDDQRALFSTAGFVDIQIFEERKKGWICVTGKKPPHPNN